MLCAESTAGYFLTGLPGLEVRWLPERQGDPEVDFVLGIGDQWIPLEVEYQARIDPVRDVRALIQFVEKLYHRSQFGILVTRKDLAVTLDPRIVALPLSSLLRMR
ncbi:MAG: hypothetical protein HY815_33190 [Candidatus Riflebacteria bacterium]|nr:hypothetical protein [Candidatus Riflebacteria bacterium]